MRSYVRTLSRFRYLVIAVFALLAGAFGLLAMSFIKNCTLAMDPVTYYWHIILSTITRPSQLAHYWMQPIGSLLDAAVRVVGMEC